MFQVADANRSMPIDRSTPTTVADRASLRMADIASRSWWTVEKPELPRDRKTPVSS